MTYLRLMRPPRMLQSRVFARRRPTFSSSAAARKPSLGSIQDLTWISLPQTGKATSKCRSTSALRLCDRRSRRVCRILISSGAALGGSPISGGYAGAKRMQMFLAGYAQKESDLLGRGIRFVSLAPLKNHAGDGARESGRRRLCPAPRDPVGGFRRRHDGSTKSGRCRGRGDDR